VNQEVEGFTFVSLHTRQFIIYIIIIITLTITSTLPRHTPSCYTNLFHRNLSVPVFLCWIFNAGVF